MQDLPDRRKGQGRLSGCSALRRTTTGHHRPRRHSHPHHLKNKKPTNMINKLIYPKDLLLDDKKIACCPPIREPKQPPSGQDPDCCYNTWQHELDHVNRVLASRNSELAYINKDLKASTDRLDRLFAWNSELVLA